MSQALYRKYRSKSLAEVVGQDHVTDLLSRALQQGKVAHAYLLTGPRGVGKTSIARILAHEINQLPYSDESSHLDIIEIDAASNNSVEDIRDLRDKVQIAPVSAAKKVYIIDEVHMLSKSAFNALLKTLEEPPAHVVFILATTDADKLPATIISRTQHFGFRPIAPETAARHLRTIATAENIAISDDALQLIAEYGQGSFRDSISTLDQLANLTSDKEEISIALIEAAIGLAPSELVDTLLQAHLKKDLPSIVRHLDRAEQQGTQPVALAAQLTRTVRSRLVESPQLLPLLDKLLLVAPSPQPGIKLLVALAPAEPKGKTVALAAPAPVVSASIAELEAQATHQPTPAQTAATTPMRKQIPTPKQSTKPATIAPAATTAPAVVRTGPAVAIADFNWNDLLDYVRTHHIALHSVLNRCGHEIEGNTMTLYTSSAFYKKKLDDAKYSAQLNASLQSIGIDNLEIATVPTAMPPKDSQAAAVAAIMGGGEEVSID